MCPRLLRLPSPCPTLGDKGGSEISEWTVSHRQLGYLVPRLHSDRGISLRQRGRDNCWAMFKVWFLEWLSLLWISSSAYPRTLFFHLPVSLYLSSLSFQIFQISAPSLPLCKASGHRPGILKVSTLHCECCQQVIGLREYTNQKGVGQHFYGIQPTPATDGFYRNHQKKLSGSIPPEILIFSN